MDDVYNRGFYLARGFANGDEESPSEAFWQRFFGNIADSIISLYHPRTVLDAGCAAGYLVSALRKRGVEAYGFDVSKDAIAYANPSVREYLFVHSLLENTKPAGLPKKVDLVTNIEVLEHLYEEDAQAALATLCQFSDSILFCSGAADVTDATHVNVRQPEYWAKQFAKLGFYRPPEGVIPPNLPDAQFFIRKQEQSVPLLCAHYEHIVHNLYADSYFVQPQYAVAVDFDCGTGFLSSTRYTTLQSECRLNWLFSVLPNAKTLRLHLPLQENTFAYDINVSCEGHSLPLTLQNGACVLPQDAVPYQKEGIYASLQDLPFSPEEAIVHVQANIYLLHRENPLLRYTLQKQTKNTLESKVQTLQEELEALQAKQFLLHHKYTILHSHFTDAHRIAKDYEYLHQSYANSRFWRISAPLRKVHRTLVHTLTHSAGFRRFVCRRTQNRIWSPSIAKFALSFYGPYAPFLPTEKEAILQTARHFQEPLRIGLVCPLHAINETHLCEMLQSVLAQTYPHWTLYLADSSDDTQSHVQRIVQRFIKIDGHRRIQYIRCSSATTLASSIKAAVSLANTDYLALIEQGDLLNPSALYFVREAIEKQGADAYFSDDYTFLENNLYQQGEVRYKPNFSIDNLRTGAVFAPFLVIQASLLSSIGNVFSEDFSGAELFDLCLRISEATQKIAHIPKVLYFLRGGKPTDAFHFSHTVKETAAKSALHLHLARCGLAAEVTSLSQPPCHFKVNYALHGTPLVSILIANKDAGETLSTCVQSIFKKSTYTNYEIIIVENGSIEPATFALYDELKKDNRVHILKWDKGFNYSAINNYAARFAHGDYFVLLNNDIEVISPNWIQEMLMYAQRRDVGAVGAKLYYPDDTIQHAGVVVGQNGVAGHNQTGDARSCSGYLNNLILPRNVSAVTAACLMLSRTVFEEVNGLNEAFCVAFNDVDFCLRIQKAGYWLVYTPYCEMYHYESKSRGYDYMSEEKIERSNREMALFRTIWQQVLEQKDPFFNPNLDINCTEIRFKEQT